jgi:hypothetical protein
MRELTNLRARSSVVVGLLGNCVSGSSPLLPGQGAGGVPPFPFGGHAHGLGADLLRVRTVVSTDAYVDEAIRTSAGGKQESLPATKSVDRVAGLLVGITGLEVNRLCASGIEATNVANPEGACGIEHLCLRRCRVDHVGLSLPGES